MITNNVTTCTKFGILEGEKVERGGGCHHLGRGSNVYTLFEVVFSVGYWCIFNNSYTCI